MSDRFRPFRAVPLKRLAPRYRASAATVLPFRGRRGWHGRAARGRFRIASSWFGPTLVMAPIAAFSAVFLWDGGPQAQGVEADRLVSVPLPRGWDADPAALDAAQPQIARADAIAGGGSDTATARFTQCRGAVRTTCVVDGDTFWYGGAKIRIADINTPEVSSPGCAAEARLGAAATRRLTELLNAGAFSLEAPNGFGSRETDRYGRRLRVVTRGGESLGATLVAEGLAEEWQGTRRDWCQA